MAVQEGMGEGLQADPVKELSGMAVQEGMGEGLQADPVKELSGMAVQEGMPRLVEALLEVEGCLPPAKASAPFA